MPGKKYTEEHKVVYFENQCDWAVEYWKFGRPVHVGFQLIKVRILGISTEKLDSMGYGWIVSQNIIDVKTASSRS